MAHMRRHTSIEPFDPNTKPARAEMATRKVISGLIKENQSFHVASTEAAGFKVALAKDSGIGKKGNGNWWLLTNNLN